MQQHKLHILAIGVHPDDLELNCFGTLIKHVTLGDAVGIIDLTKGELGTRGTPEVRISEAKEAAKVIGVSIREFLDMADGFFRNDEHHQRIIIKYLRYYRPEIVITNALADRHPDHGRAGRLVADACFLAGLRKIVTDWNGEAQAQWRPRRVFHMIQDRFTEPSFIVDVATVYHQKMEAIKCYKSQFHNPDWDEPQTYISSGKFLEQIRSRDMLMGKRIGVAYGEAFTCEYTPGITDLNRLLLPEQP